ncbi:hypothetical protein FB45DRAFT_927660 [Roridomyces roridus]|uniref:Secreted protein n=1 Tax=Roridomyces roridus TaxID=1738132 RepID=A0AAD7BJ70_9AGAR|nr:hypothetical protein FB45DRAFT_927660 [Roridomyces roridus]
MSWARFCCLYASLPILPILLVLTVSRCRPLTGNAPCAPFVFSLPGFRNGSLGCRARGRSRTDIHNGVWPTSLSFAPTS